MTHTPTYTLIGAGGTGSILFSPLVRYLETYYRGQPVLTGYNLQVIDGDEIERKNLERQLFAEPAIGFSKAEALVASLGFEPALGKLFTFNEFLGADNIAKRIRDGDTVLIAVDNYSLRALVEKHGLTLDNLTVINGGNEATDGSCQLWVRRAAKNLTPPLSHGHPEIAYKGADDRAEMSCEARSKLPGGEQTIIANMQSATTMLNVLRLHHNVGVPKQGHEVHFDLNTLAMRPDDLRGLEGWS